MGWVIICGEVASGEPTGSGRGWNGGAGYRDLTEPSRVDGTLLALASSVPPLS